MIRRFPAGVSSSLAGALVLAATFVLPPSSVSAEHAAEFSSQGRQGLGDSGAGPGPGIRGGAAPQMKGPPPGAGPRGRVVAPHFGGRAAQFGSRGPAPGFGGYRGPAVGYRGPGYRGHAFIRGRHHVRRGGLLLPLIGLGALGAIYVGSRPYTPYAYVDGAVGPECSGATEDGMCELRMTEVPLETGGAELQCVAYCPQ